MQVNFPLDMEILEQTEEIRRAIINRLSKRKSPILIISGSTKSYTYAKKLCAGLDAEIVSHTKLERFDVHNVYLMEKLLRRESIKIIIGIGGGTVADFSKRLALTANVELFLVPTIIANDGLISPIAVLRENGYSISLPGKMPDSVFIDLSVIKDAPVHYLEAAACDIISNISATNDWERSTSGESGRTHHLALQLSRMAAYQVLDCREWGIDSPVFLRAIVYGQMLSGITMALAGSSRPCSGSEHLISHAIDALGLANEILHGKKVGITSRFCLSLQGIVDERLEYFFEFFKIKKDFPGCDQFSNEELQKVFSKARIMRPGRTSIIDQFSDLELVLKYRDYISS